MNTPEILAPAGSYESLVAAVRAGANAIYLGSKDFNARRNADNFSAEELQKAVKYCHSYGVSVYLALNISVTDSQMNDCLATAISAAKAGVDAFIVSDLGVAKEIKKRIPDTVLHASTQVSVHSPSALKVLKEQGFSRVVTAREMSKKELRDFCKEAEKLGMEVETFVHGALCMSVSGQCYLSALLGSRSGNRGLCAGPCRLPFAAENGTGYDLSLKDLSLIRYAKELENMGVTSFKIEGRMKRPEYVAAAVHCLKATLDGNRDSDTEELLQKVFSRSGFTDGYYTGNGGVSMFGIRTKEDSATPEVFAQLHSLYRADIPRIPVTAKLTLEASKPARLILSDNEHSVEVLGEVPSPAKTKPVDEESAREKIAKLGSTPYYLENFIFSQDGEYFLSASSLNSLKTDAAEKLTALRTAPKRLNISDVAYETPAQSKAAQTVFGARFASVSQIPSDLSNLKFIILPAEELGSYFSVGIPVIAELPRACRQEKRVSRLIDDSKSSGAVAVLCSNIAHFELANQKQMPIVSSFSMNLYNSSAARVLEESGAKAHLLSFEPTEKTLKAIETDSPKGIIIYGRLPLMLTANCPVANGGPCYSCNKSRFLTDRLGVKFPVVCREGFSEVLNSVPLVLSDTPEVFSGFDFGVMWFTDETSSKAAEIIGCYKNGSPCPVGDFTRGLYSKGVL